MAKVLVIDDDKISRKVISKSIQALHTPITAENGEQGLALAQQELPDIILLDVKMPGLNGYEVCDQLKSNAAMTDSNELGLVMQC